MTKRLTVVITDPTYDLLVRLAEHEDRKVAALVAKLLSEKLRELEKEGKIPDHNDSVPGKLAAEYLTALALNRSIDVIDIQKLALELDLPSERLAEIYNQAQGRVQNDNKSTSR